MTDGIHPVRPFSYAPGRGTARGVALWSSTRKGAALMSDGYARITLLDH
ncbi:hypothetical protein [Robbsia andropogonis]|nr:hypothetical protein [Robbsia andropogonis]MCP1120626.1 hypothetical protein [Robbsia andropogonis]MCP1130361.1 hypothetical protein [Robbsia andropogonis]